jgi:hypothetical protein
MTAGEGQQQFTLPDSLLFFSSSSPGFLSSLSHPFFIISVSAVLGKGFERVSTSRIVAA